MSLFNVRQTATAVAIAKIHRSAHLGPKKLGVSDMGSDKHGLRGHALSMAVVLEFGRGWLHHLVMTVALPAASRGKRGLDPRSREHVLEKA